jgi:chromosome partitioning protein
LGIDKRKLQDSVYDTVVNDVPTKQVIVNTPYGDVLPATADLAGAAVELISLENPNMRLKNALAQVKDDYDVIFIDCPPSLEMLTVNALAAADGILVPVQCEYYALEGLTQLMMTISKVKKLYNPSLCVLGILVTMYNSRLLLSMQVLSELKKHYADKLFNTEISRNVKLSEAPGFGKPVYYHDRRSKGSVEYMDVAKELRSRI